jgi:hypothetical protein
MNGRIPWSRLLAESIAVILSILAAFAIDAWWDQRQADGLERELLATLETSFEENRRLAHEVMQEARRQHLLLSRFVDMTLAEASAIPEDSVYHYLRGLWRPNYVNRGSVGSLAGGNLNNASILATLEAGRLALLADSRLLGALAEWQGLVADLEERNAEIIVLEREVLSAMARHPELQAALAGGFTESSGEFRSFAAEMPRLSGAVARRVREDNEVMSRAARKGFYSRIQVDFLEDLEAQADAILLLVRANQHR